MKFHVFNINFSQPILTINSIQQSHDYLIPIRNISVILNCLLPFSFCSSFFPTIMQPFINLLVTPLYKISLNIGLVKHQPIIPLSSSSSEMRPLTTLSSDQHQQETERRRAIALKALNERWKALNADGSKSHQLPKSFPMQQQASAGGFSHHGHSHERKVIPKFNIDEIMKPIPMPAPPGMMPAEAPSSQSPDSSPIN